LQKKKKKKKKKVIFGHWAGILVAQISLSSVEDTNKNKVTKAFNSWY
jgi:hypothetical protein